MAFLSIIRRWHKREHVPIREISRRLGVSRNTIRKYLRSEVIEPKFQIPDRPSKLDPYAEKLSAWLRREENRPRKQRRTIKQLYGDLVSLGYDGSYNRVAAFARLEGGVQTGSADGRPGHLRAPGLWAGRSIPVRLERGFCRHWQHPDQAAGCALQALPQSSLHHPCLSIANA
jgi:transcriptional regulator with XRE-family HTH domain